MWRTWLDAARGPLAAGGALPPFPPTDGVVGLQVTAPVDDLEPWFDDAVLSSVNVGQCVIRRVSGTALQVDAGLRVVEVRGVEAWTSVRGGFISGERVLLAESTWHRHAAGLAIAPCLLTAADCLFTATNTGPALVLDAEVELGEVAATFASNADIPFAMPPSPLYREPGPLTVPPSVIGGSLAPVAPVDLRLVDDALHDLAVRVPGDDLETPVFLGAHVPDVEQRCELRDPLPVPVDVAPAAVPGPFVDYRARDARSLLASWSTAPGG